MIILLHSSKTMRAVGGEGKALRKPRLLQQAQELGTYLKSLPAAELKKTMHLSTGLAEKTHQLLADWNTQPAQQSLALDSFVGDIYRGLRANDLSTTERDYADKHLYILSGLYGCIRPYDGIRPYRLEMMYKLPTAKYKNLYDFWGDSIARCLPKDSPIVNLSSVEYAKAVLPHLNPARVISPEFLTIDPKTKQPTFVAVHAKVTRGAFARWLIKHQADSSHDLETFNELNYSFNKGLSTPGKPTFVCTDFGGLGLTV